MRESDPRLGFGVWQVCASYVPTWAMIFWIFVVVCAALTLYCATAILPLSSTTNVERMTPVFSLVSSLLA